jgi:hypothetical protein
MSDGYNKCEPTPCDLLKMWTRATRTGVSEGLTSIATPTGGVFVCICQLTASVHTVYVFVMLQEFIWSCLLKCDRVCIGDQRTLARPLLSTCVHVNA